MWFNDFPNEFSVEYTSGDVTKSQPDELRDTEAKEETKSGESKYGLSKPQRRRIRGKIINGQGWWAT